MKIAISNLTINKGYIEKFFQSVTNILTVGRVNTYQRGLYHSGGPWSDQLRSKRSLNRILKLSIVSVYGIRNPSRIVQFHKNYDYWICSLTNDKPTMIVQPNLDVSMLPTILATTVRFFETNFPDQPQ